MLLFAATPNAIAQSGKAGDLTWSISNGTLIIDGMGAIPDYEESALAPWFAYQQKISSVVIGDSVTNIGNNAFRSCDLTSIIIPNSVKTIGISAFEDCDSLASITIPNSIVNIDKRLFFGCSGLISVIIPYSVTSISDDAFYACRKLTSIIIPNSVTSIGIHAFAWSGLTSINIPSSIITIGYGAFWDCELTSVNIPSRVTEIGWGAFNQCAINVDIDNSVYSSVDGVLLSKDARILFIFPCGKSTSYNIPTSVNSFGFKAFSDCRDLTSVIIPSSFTNFGDMAFAYCNGLTEITNLATIPQIIDNFIFSSVDKNKCILRVPSTSVREYRKAKGWSEFKKIEAIVK